jgi:hypothetical protein
MLVSGTYRDMIVGSVYMPHDSEDLPPHEEIKKLAEYASSKGLELLLGCHVNCHHEVWCSTDINPRGKNLLDFIMHSELHILDTGRELTLLDSRRQEVKGITSCIEGLTNLVRDWRVSCLPLELDHTQVHYALDQI